jgi:hypothetical protein
MKIGVISDIHENFHNLLIALKKMEELDVKQIICLGDLMNDGVAKILSISKIPVFMIWGNNDGDRVVLTKTACRPGSNLSVSSNTYDFLEFDNRKIFITHYEDLAEPMAKSGLYDIVFCGHTHITRNEKINDCIIINPGEISAQKTGFATLSVYDTTTNSAVIMVLENTVTLKTLLADNFFKKNRDALGFRSDFKI